MAYDNKKRKPAAKTKVFWGTTSIDDNHSHYYQVDIDGNGWALKSDQGRQSKAKYKHKIINWIIKPEYQHTHKAIQKNVLRWQESRFAKLLPIVDIERVSLEHSNNSALKSTVEFLFMLLYNLLT